MKLSIITVCYNIKDEIQRTCESIVNQSYQDFEWIVIDGGSTDGTLDLLNNYKDRIDIFVSEKDNGIFDAMNKGIVKAQGKYLNFMNGGDEFYKKDVLKNFIKELSSPTTDNADIYYGNTSIIRHGKHVITALPTTIEKTFFLDNNLNHQSAFIKKELFDTYGYYEVRPLASDYEMWLVYCENNCSYKKLDFVVAKFYWEGASTSLENMKEIRMPIYDRHFTKDELLHNFFDKKIKALQNSLNGNIESNKAISKEYYKLFNFLPILKVQYINNKTVYLLFNKIPIIVKHKQ